MGRRARAQAATGPCLFNFLLYDRARATRIQTSGPQERHRTGSPRAHISSHHKKSAVLIGMFAWCKHDRAALFSRKLHQLAWFVTAW